MSDNNEHKRSASSGQPAGQPAGQYFPPPPPGPPAIQTANTQQRPQHPNETPILDYDIPAYDPRHPRFAPPPKDPSDDDDIYGATPTDEHPPPFPPRPVSSGRHSGDDDDDAPKASWSKRLSGWGTKAAAPFNALANKMGAETFLPTTMDKECEKAARILRSFCKDGIYGDAPAPSASATATNPGAPAGDAGPHSDKPTEASKGKKPHVLLTIPSKVIARAQGLAIFTTARAGFQVSGATGSGILIARRPDGSWSPPSGIQVHSVGAGFVIGVDIYDCVVVINTREALNAFTRTRMSLGSDLAVTAGPWGAGGALDWGMPQASRSKEKAPAESAQGATLAPPPADHQPQSPQPQAATGASTGPQPEDSGAAGASIKRKPSPFREAVANPVYSYVKSRGFYAGVQIDGTVVTERKDANAVFYGAPVSVAQIFNGEVPPQGPPGMWPTGARGLLEVLKGAEGWRGVGQPSPLAGISVPGSYGSAVPSGANPGAPAAVLVPNASGTRSAATDLHDWKYSGSSAPGTSAFSGGPAPPPGPGATTSAADAKAAEAAAEAARAAQTEPLSPAPPSYTEPTGAGDLPPAYVEGEQYRSPGGSADSKTGLH